LQEKPNVFILHCGLDIKRVEKSCEKLDLSVNITAFRREEVFAYYVRLARPHPDLIVIRSHFRTLVDSMKLQRDTPTIVVSTHQEPANCHYPYIQAQQGYKGSDASKLYEQMAQAIFQALSCR
jgi:hypothetical protein